MFCKVCGNQTENQEGICSDCLSKQTASQSEAAAANEAGMQQETQVPPITFQKPVNAPPPEKTEAPAAAAVKKSMGYLNEAIFIKAAVFAGITLAVSFLLSLLVSVILNLAAGTAVNSLFNNSMSGGMLGGGDINVINVYTIWRLSFFHTFVFSMGTAGVNAATISFQLHVILLLGIPFLSFFIGWALFANKNVRKAASFLFKPDEDTEDRKTILTIIAITAMIYVVFFSVTSFISIRLGSAEDFLEIFSVKVHFSFLSSFFYTFIVVALCNLVIARIRGVLHFDKLFSKIPLLHTLLPLYARYLLGVAVVSVVILLVMGAGPGIWKQLLLLILLLPNIVLFMANALLGGGYSLYGAGNATTLMGGMSNGISKAAAVLMAIVFIVFLSWCFAKVFLKGPKENKADYWRKAAAITGGIIIIQLAAFLAARIGLSIGSMGEKMAAGISLNIVVALLMTAAAGGIGAAAAYYRPGIVDFLKSGQEPSAELGEKKNKKAYLIVYAGISVTALILSLLMFHV